MTATEQLQQESLQFSQFIKRLIEKNPNVSVSMEEALAEFRAYEIRMERIREELRPAFEASLRGESTPLDMSKILDEVLVRLKAKGIT